MKYTYVPDRILRLILFSGLLVSGINAIGLEVTNLKCEYSSDPLGIDVMHPRLFWQLESSVKEAEQSAYQILVSNTREDLDSDIGNLWDSGKVESGTSSHVPYGGRPLVSSQKVFWKLRVWNETDEPSEWSKPATWTMGILDQDSWIGKWIESPDECESLLLRKIFGTRDGLVRAIAHVSGLGHYELYVNGEKIGNEVLSPGWTNYDKTILYDTRDITRFLNKGQNAVGLILGNGMYHVRRKGRFSKFEGSFGSKRAIVDIHLEYDDGHHEVIGSDGSWKIHSGPITYSNIYGGEDHDARLLDADWCRSVYDDSGWKPAVVCSGLQKSELMGHSGSADPVIPIETRQPVELRELAGPGAFLYDFGQNASYMPRLRISGPAGSVVRLIPGETIFPDGYVSRASMGGIHRGTSWWEYTKATDEEETWFPKFFYIGSRYIQSQAIAAGDGDELPVIQSLEGVIVHSAAQPIGDFETSNPLLNQIRDLVRWAQRSNMVSVLTDCPHREKLGWLEQYHLNGPAIRYEFDMARMFTKGMRDMEDAQTADGMVPNIAPEYTTFKGSFRAAAEWGAAFIVVPWQQYLFSGDVDLIREHYPAMKRYFSYLESRAENLILSDGLGDWFDLGPRRPPGRAQLTAAPVTSTAFFFYDAKLMARMASILGQDEDAEYFADKAEAIRQQYNKTFFNTEGGYYATNSQCANSLALVMGIVEEKHREAVMNSLLEDLKGRGYSMTAGDIGFRFLLLALSEGGQDEAIYRMINQDETPGYGYQIKMGATALTEAWDGNSVTSNNHFMLGHITEWFYGRLLGISPDPERPGFKNIILQPTPVGDLKWVQGSYASLHGSISVEWSRDSESFNYSVDIPPNTTATLFLPAINQDNIMEKGKPIDQTAGIQYSGMEDERAVLHLEPGRYSFTSRLATNLALPDWLPEGFPVPEVNAAGEALCVRYFLSPEQAESVLDSALQAFPEKADWEAYKNLLREKIREGAGLLPWPKRTPLNAIVNGERSYPGYKVRNVAFESIPGYWVTGNLYLPENPNGKVPAILHPHGHSGNVNGSGGWENHGRFKEDVQYRAASMALMGAVSLTIDMFGYGDSTAQLGLEAHRDRVAMPMQIWNAIRALDYLQGLDIVDPEKLGVTGHSGGGTQSFLLSALDDRIKVCVPVAMVSARFFGGCLCESGRPIHLTNEHFANNAMITAMTVPRPLMVISDGGDWTDQVPDVEFPYLQEVYRDYGALDNLENVHLPQEGHNYGLSKRVAMYPFMAKHLGLNLSAILDGKGEIDESQVVIESPDKMRVFNESNPLPVGALENADQIGELLEKPK